LAFDGKAGGPSALRRLRVQVERETIAKAVLDELSQQRDEALDSAPGIGPHEKIEAADWSAVRLDRAVRAVARQFKRKERSIRNIFYDETKDGREGRLLRADYEELEGAESLEPDTF
jgi:hypothetical protein